MDVTTAVKVMGAKNSIEKGMRKAASSFAAGSEPLISKSEDTARSSTKRKKSIDKSSRSGSTASLSKKSEKTKRKHSESSASIKAEGDYEFD
jgi:hypothetical protein